MKAHFVCHCALTHQIPADRFIGQVESCILCEFRALTHLIHAEVIWKVEQFHFMKNLAHRPTEPQTHSILAEGSAKLNSCMSCDSFACRPTRSIVVHHLRRTTYIPTHTHTCSLPSTCRGANDVKSVRPRPGYLRRKQEEARLRFESGSRQYSQPVGACQNIDHAGSWFLQTPHNAQAGQRRQVPQPTAWPPVDQARPLGGWCMDVYLVARLHRAGFTRERERESLDI